MITLKISKTDLERLNYERFYYPSPLIQKRLHALFLEGQKKYSRSEIASILGIDRNSITHDLNIIERDFGNGQKKNVCMPNIMKLLTISKQLLITQLLVQIP